MSDIEYWSIEISRKKISTFKFADNVDDWNRLVSPITTQFVLRNSKTKVFEGILLIS